MVHFTAPWCGPRRLIAPYFSQLAKNHPSVIFLEVDVDELKVKILELFLFFPIHHIIFQQFCFLKILLYTVACARALFFFT